MRTAEDYRRKHPRALPTTLAFIDRRNEMVERLNRELDAKKAAEQPARKSIIGRFIPWFGRRA
jgi:hypothetical protein